MQALKEKLQMKSILKYKQRKKGDVVVISEELRLVEALHVLENKAAGIQVVGNFIIINTIGAFYIGNGLYLAALVLTVNTAPVKMVNTLFFC